MEVQVLYDSRVFSRCNKYSELNCNAVNFMGWRSLKSIFSSNKQVKYSVLPRRFLARLDIFVISKEVTDFGVQLLLK